MLWTSQKKGKQQHLDKRTAIKSLFHGNQSQDKSNFEVGKSDNTKHERTFPGDLCLSVIWKYSCGSYKACQVHETSQFSFSFFACILKHYLADCFEIIGYTETYPVSSSVRKPGISVDKNLLFIDNLIMPVDAHTLPTSRNVLFCIYNVCIVTLAILYLVTSNSPLLIPLDLLSQQLLLS